MKVKTSLAIVSEGVKEDYAWLYAIRHVQYWPGDLHGEDTVSGILAGKSASNPGCNFRVPVKFSNSIKAPLHPRDEYLWTC